MNPSKTKQNLIYGIHTATLSVYKLTYSFTSQRLNGDFLFSQFPSGGRYSSLFKLNYEMYIYKNVLWYLRDFHDSTQYVSIGLPTKLEIRSENWNARILTQQICTIFQSIIIYFKNWSTVLHIISEKHKVKGQNEPIAMSHLNLFSKTWTLLFSKCIFLSSFI